MNKKIWIFNEYAGSIYHGMNFRHYYLSKELIKLGYEITIFTSSFSHFTLKPHRTTNKMFNIEYIDGIRYVWVDMPKYSGARSLGRIRNWFLFAFKLFFIPRLDFDKPDTIISSSLPLHPIFPAKYFSKKYEAKLIFEVRDIWPLSAIAIGGYSKGNLFIKHLQYIEDYAYRNADSVVSLLSNSLSHMKTRGLSGDKFSYIPNGIFIDENNINEPLEDEVIRQLPESKFIVGYAGTIGSANALDSFVEAAKLLNRESAITFVIVGNGNERASLIRKAQDSSNIVFIDQVRKNQMQSMIKKFDVCYIGWLNREIYNHGISANKIFDYMYASRPILHSFSGECDFIETSKSGITVEAESSEQIAQAVLTFRGMSDAEREEMGKNGLRYVLENHDYKILAGRYSKLL